MLRNFRGGGRKILFGGVRNFRGGGVEKFFLGGGLRNFRVVEKFQGGLRFFREGLEFFERG